MMRRCCCLWFSSYYVPQLSRVAIFPLHLDPPTKQHRHLFRALLGFRHGKENGDDEAMSLVSQSLGEKKYCEDCECGDDVGGGCAYHRNKHSRDGKNIKNSHTNGSRDGSRGIHKRGNKDASAERGYAFSATMTNTAAFGRDEDDDEHDGSSESQQFWYMSSLEESLRMDSQLAPFDDIILIPNTRYPVSLRRSTHLAALAVLGTRGLPHVHVEFTALEHPDDTMSVIHEFTQHYRNCALVHWLQDAYEMHDWRSFNQMKIEVPLLLLQTHSLPTSQLAQRPPSRQVMQRMREQQHATRLYHAPTDSNIRSESERHYYAQVRAHMQEMARQRLYEQGLLSRNDGVKPEEEEEEVAENRRAAAGNEDHTFSDERGRTGSGGESRMHRTERATATGGRADEPADSAPSHAPSGQSSVAARSSNIKESEEEHHYTDTEANTQMERSYGHSGNDIATHDSHLTHIHSYADPLSQIRDHHDIATHTTGEDGSPYYNPVSHACPAHDQPVKGEWWLTPGGRGDDSVEINKMYTQSEGSSWLGAGDGYTSSPEDSGFGSSSGPGFAEEATAATTTTTSSEDGSGTLLRASPTKVTESTVSEPTNTPPRASAATSSSPSSSSSTGVQISSASRPPSRRSRHGQRSVRELIEELYPPIRPLRSSNNSNNSSNSNRAGGAHTSRRTHVTANTTTSGATSAVPENHPASPHASDAREHRRTVEHHQARDDAGTQHADDEHDSRPTHTSAHALPERADSLFSAHAGLTESPGDDDAARVIPMVEVQPVTRCTGADVRHALWTRELDPSLILTDCVLRYIESHMLYRDSRKSLSMRGSSGGGLRNTGDAARLHGLGGGGGSGNSSSSSSGAMVGGGGYYHHPSHAPGHHLYHGSSGSSLSSHHGSHPYRSAWGAGAGAGAGAAGSSSPDGVGVRERWSSSGSSRGHGGDAMSGPTTQSSGGGSPDLYHWGSRPSSHGLLLSAASPLAAAAAAAASASFASSAALSAPYVHRPSLHRGGTSTMSYSGIIPRLELHYDRNNLVAREHYETLRVFECLDGEEPDLIVPIGGDGYMLHCIRENWRRFIPFYGVNAGHVGYLLNDRSTLDELFSSPLKLHTTTMLYCQAERESDTGEHILISELAFNDAWIERAGGQTALIRVLVNGEERIRRFYGDGVLVSTPAGSTAYSRALGASPLPVGSPLIQVVGSNVVQPAQWRPVHLDQEDEVVFEVMDTVKRPCHCYVDSVSVGNVTHLLVRSSRVASVSLVFSKSFDLHQKLYALQFPQTL